MDVIFRLLDFNIYNKELSNASGGRKSFVIQIFGKDAEGKTYSVFIEHFQPFFYVKIPEGQVWNGFDKNRFVESVKNRVCNKKNRGEIRNCELLERQKLYGFDAAKKYQFIKLNFANTTIMNRAKKLWYDYIDDETSRWGRTRILKAEGYQKTHIYESNIPPLLRYFHIQNLSPSGWAGFSSKKASKPDFKKTMCDYEYTIAYDNLFPIANKEESVPLIICSFDIEASSSHGDFPLPIKKYKKLVMDILDYWDNNDVDAGDEENILRRIILTAFGMDDVPNIHRIYPKHTQNYRNINKYIEQWLKMPIKNLIRDVDVKSSVADIAEDNSEEFKKWWRSKPRVKDTALDILNNSKYDRGDKLIDLNKSLTSCFPAIKGDKVTFIGSTFTLLGEKQPYLKHCIALGECAPVENATIESCRTEREVLLAWTDLIQREMPDVLIGYNIFGFDFPFMLDRAHELDCKEDFVKLSKNRDKVCNVKKTSIKIASGVHELTYIEAPGMLELDLYNYFRREVNLPSYKLDNVASHFIGDNVKTYDYMDGNTIFKSGNLMGLQDRNFIRLEEIGHSTEYYADGQKFEVFDVDCEKSEFKIHGNIQPDKSKQIRWSLAKDDVTPQDIFHLSNGGPADLAIVAKYCIMDCLLVQFLMDKNDIFTGFMEVSSICSVPISFIIMRGQGIKLLSFIAKKCREKGILLPDIRKGGKNEGYEGAICLPPQCNLYLENPIACVDYGSLYPSSMISENISQDSKVWTKEYDLDGHLIAETGDHQYDNLDDYEYVDIEYDTYRWIRKHEKGREIKTKVGKKMCRFAQYPDGKLAVMPSILVELLGARKATRAFIKYKTITTNDGNKYSGLLSSDEEHYYVKQKDGSKVTIVKGEVASIHDTFNDFMKNVFDKRQLGLKITANSLYGQCGAKTSSFYDKDIAAATTATGRKLLIYGKNVIECVYANRICDTSFGKVRTKAKVIYGDTDSCFFTFNLEDMDGNKITGKKALIITIELAQEAGKLATSMLKPPHDLEYEKTFLPWALLSKKRYVGMLYECDPNKCKRKSMGIVLKRRDNAPIVKEVYGGVIDILMRGGEVEEAIQFTQGCINNMIDEKYPMRKLIITKSLRGFYKNPKTIAHKVLAERMGKRDPGTKPKTGTRIPFAYIQTKGGKKKLQGDRIEHPDFIRKNKLKLDYVFYITNQIMKPILQIFALPEVLNKIPKFQRRKRQFYRNLTTLKHQLSDEQYAKKEIQIRNKEVEELIFSDLLRKAENKRSGGQNIKSFFGAISS